MQHSSLAAAAAAGSSSLAYRNELYDRTAGYDVPRSTRRNNLHLDLNPNRPRYTTASRPHRQRSFDDTESYQYQNYLRYENIYEQIHEEPIINRNYGGTTGGSASGGGRVYGRLDVIGHGIGRIERHLSSSCGNIDHYNLGGHYAVLGHSHLGTMGHIRLNATNSTQSARDHRTSDDAEGKSGYSFFSCLGGENSQSMSNIYRATNGSNGNQQQQHQIPVAPPPLSNTLPSTSSSSSRTGAIPKTKNNKNSTTTSVVSTTTTTTPSTASSLSSTVTSTSSKKNNQSPEHSTALNRISKSSLQWLLVNKWLPLWVGGQTQATESDYKIIDFNFMFSRKCEGCGVDDNTLTEPQQGLVRFNGQAEMRQSNYSMSNFRSNTPSSTTSSNNNTYSRVLRNNPNIVRLRECEYGSPRPRDLAYGRSQNEYMRSCRSQRGLGREQEPYADPFRNWELNAENNTFRPAGGRVRDIRRITDGTFRNTELRSNAKMIKLSTTKLEPIPSTSTSSSSSTPTTTTNTNATNVNAVPENLSIASDRYQRANNTNNKEEAIYYQNSECTEDDQEEVSELSEADDDDE